MFIKLTQKDHNQHGYIYHKGLNTDPGTHGLHFTDDKHWTEHIQFTDDSLGWIWECKPVGDFEKISEGIYKANSIDISNPTYILSSPEILIKVEWDYIFAITGESFHLNIIKNCSRLIKYVDNPSLELQLCAVRKNGFVIDLIQNPSDVVIVEALKQNGKAICNVKNPKLEFQLIAVKQNGKAIKHISNPSKEVIEEALKQNPEAKKFIDGTYDKWKKFKCVQNKK